MIKRYREPLEIEKKEVARYLGYKNFKLDDVVSKLIDQKINELKCDLKVCYIPLNVKQKFGNKIDFGYFSVESLDFSKFVGDSKEVVLFGATIGIEFDRLLKRELVLSPSGAAVLQAVGTAKIEALCDLFCDKFCTKARFSPGYGDLDLSVQRDIFKLLNMEKNIGVSLTESLIMTPTKSVTAFLIPNNLNCMDCEKCNQKKTCTFKKG